MFLIYSIWTFSSDLSQVSVEDIEEDARISAWHGFERARQLGKEMGKEGNYQQAHKAYSDCLEFGKFLASGPPFLIRGSNLESSEVKMTSEIMLSKLAIVLLRRAAVLYALKEPRLCVLDIDAALRSCVLPSADTARALVFKGNALLQLRQVCALQA